MTPCSFAARARRPKLMALKLLLEKYEL